MKKIEAYSLVEVLVAAAITAVAIAAAAVMVNTLIRQEEINTASVRAANLQEQATVLYRLGFTNLQTLSAILPEPCAATASPPSGAFGFVLGESRTNNATVSLAGGGSASIAYEVTPLTIVFTGSPEEQSYTTNTVGIVRPVIRFGP